MYDNRRKHLIDPFSQRPWGGRGRGEEPQALLDPAPSPLPSASTLVVGRPTPRQRQRGMQSRAVPLHRKRTVHNLAMIYVDT